MAPEQIVLMPNRKFAVVTEYEIVATGLTPEKIIERKVEAYRKKVTREVTATTDALKRGDEKLPYQMHNWSWSKRLHRMWMLGYGKGDRWCKTCGGHGEHTCGVGTIQESGNTFEVAFPLYPERDEDESPPIDSEE